MKESDVEWCRFIWRSLKDGGVWMVPRSGLVFTKRDPDVFILTERDQIYERSMQEADFRAIRAHFAEIGVDVLDSSR